MNLAILHYHLNRGGVTRVIVNHLRSLDAVGAKTPVRVLHGGRCEAWPDDLAGSLANVELETATVPGFDYDDGTTFDPAPLHDSLRGALDDAGFAPTETVLHVHNHSLGKNLAFPVVLGELAREGFGLLLHVHDFAEDFRGANYARMATAYGDDLGRLLYPNGPRVHFAVLNRRDFDVLRGAGVPDARLHFLPNPVPSAESNADRDAARADLQSRFGVPADRPYLLYPVRAIRRKNVGEAVLWSALLGDEAAIGVTLAPLNPVEREPYEAWVRFAAEQGVPTLFGVGDDGGLGFHENLAAADGVLTTSVAEGFGMAFLEPWTFERLLVGRNLPEITADFVDEGLDLRGLYERLPIPVEWVGRDAFATAFRSAATRLAEAYGRDVEAAAVETSIARKLADDVVDFGDLDEAMQRTVVERVAHDDGARRELRASLPDLLAVLNEARSTVAANRAVVEERYSPESCGHRLRAIHERIAADGPVPIDLPALSAADGVLASFGDLDRLRLLRG